MIRFQPTAALPGYLLIGSDHPDLEQARLEVDTWAKTSGCELTTSPRRLSVFHGDNLVREWTLIPLPSQPVAITRETVAVFSLPG